MSGSPVGSARSWVAWPGKAHISLRVDWLTRFRRVVSPVGLARGRPRRWCRPAGGRGIGARSAHPLQRCCRGLLVLPDRRARPQGLYRRKHPATDRFLVLPQVLRPARIIACQVVGDRVLRLPNRILRRRAHGHLEFAVVHRHPNHAPRQPQAGPPGRASSESTRHFPIRNETFAITPSSRFHSGASLIAHTPRENRCMRRRIFTRPARCWLMARFVKLTARCPRAQGIWW